MPEINYNDIFRAKLNKIDKDNEPCTKEELADVEFKLRGITLDGSTSKLIPLPPHNEYDNDINKVYWNYLYDIYRNNNNEPRVEVTKTEHHILLELESLSEAIHICSTGFGNKVCNIPSSYNKIIQHYPSFQGNRIIKDYSEEYASYLDSLTLEEWVRNKLKSNFEVINAQTPSVAEEMNRCFQRFVNKARDNNGIITTKLPFDLRDECVRCGLLTEDYEPKFFSHPSMGLSNRLRLMGEDYDRFL